MNMDYSTKYIACSLLSIQRVHLHIAYTTSASVDLAFFSSSLLLLSFFHFLLFPLHTLHLPIGVPHLVYTAAPLQLLRTHPRLYSYTTPSSSNILLTYTHLGRYIYYTLLPPPPPSLPPPLPPPLCKFQLRGHAYARTPYLLPYSILVCCGDSVV